MLGCIASGIAGGSTGGSDGVVVVGDDDISVAVIGAKTGEIVGEGTATTGLNAWEGVGNRFCGRGDSGCIPGRATPICLVGGGALAPPPIADINGDL